MLKQTTTDGGRRVFQNKSVFLHSTEKEFMCVCSKTTSSIPSDVDRLSLEGHV